MTTGSSEKPFLQTVHTDFGLRSRTTPSSVRLSRLFYTRSSASRSPVAGAGYRHRPGVVALPLAERGANVIGTDISENQIEAAREQAKRAAFGSMRVRSEPCEHSRFANNSFD